MYSEYRYCSYAGHKYMVIQTLIKEFEENAKKMERHPMIMN